MEKSLQLMPVNDIMIMAKTFADSGMFTDAKQMGQAFVKIQAGQEIGIPPFAAMSGIHIIQGKPTIGAGLIASTIKGSGKYDYLVKEMTDKICTIDFYQNKELIGTSSFTIQEAVKAGTKNIDRFPKNMLFARAISNGVKWYTPDVFAGAVYTPEEMESVKTKDVSHEVVIEQIDYADALNSCSSLEELSECYLAMPKGKQIEFKELAANLKYKFPVVPS